jgi:hypothetical protein
MTWAQWTGGVALAPGSLPFPTRSPRLDDRWRDAICRAFTAADVAASRANPPDDRLVDVERHEFGQMDHISTGGEETLVLYRGTSDGFKSALDFAVRTVLRDLWDDPFGAPPPRAANPATDRYLMPVTRGSFWQRWRGHCAGLRNPPPLPALAPDSHFLGAQYIEGDWNNWAFVAAHQYDYFALFWSTTA